MRIWDVAAGYLNRQSLLGEHRELHGLYNILVQGKKGYARHPETLRWVGCVTGLCGRHDLLLAEMALRGYVDRSPLPRAPRRPRWPAVFVTPPGEQLALLARKYSADGGKEPGRIPLPKSAQELWAHHKYSVMARDPEAYRAIGRRVAGLRRGSALGDLAAEVALILRQAPPAGRATNAVEHMWGHVNDAATPDERSRARRGGAAALLAATRELALRQREPFLLASTALSELAAYLPPPPPPGQVS